MAVTIIRPKNREEWLQYRESGVGSSESGTIIGVNPYETKYQLWRRKMKMDGPKTDNMPMRLGHLMEDAVATLWAEETNREVIKASAGDWIGMNPEKTFLKASPDRTFWIPGAKRNNENKGIVECKTTQMTIDEEDIPKSWFTQLQYQLGTLEMSEGSIAWLSMGRTFGYRDYKLAPSFYGWVVEEVEKFWVDNILGGQEPEMTDASDVLIKYGKHTESKVIEVGEDILNAYSNLKELKDRIKELEAEKEAYENQIKMVFQDAEAIVYNGSTLATWKTAKDSVKIDTGMLAKVHPTIVQAFQVTTPGSRRFLLK